MVNRQQVVLHSNNANYQAKYDYARALGRGIATISASYYSQHPMWVVNGIEDKQDLRHNSTVGNWVNMEDLKYVIRGLRWATSKISDEGNRYHFCHKIPFANGLIFRFIKSIYMML
jgi:hypothetical protein